MLGVLAGGKEEPLVLPQHPQTPRTSRGWAQTPHLRPAAILPQVPGSRTGCPNAEMPSEESRSQQQEQDLSPSQWDWDCPATRRRLEELYFREQDYIGAGFEDVHNFWTFFERLWRFQSRRTESEPTPSRHNQAEPLPSPAASTCPANTTPSTASTSWC